MFSNVRNIFSAAVRNVATAGLALMIAASPAWAQALDVGQVDTPNAIKSEFLAEGHQISSAYNQIVIVRGDETHEAEMRDFANIITTDSDGDWYLIFSNAPLGGENTFLRVESKGTNLTYYQPDPDTHIIPPGPTENIDLMREMIENGQDVVSRSYMLRSFLEKDSTSYLAFSGQVTDADNNVVGHIDGIVSKNESGRKGLGIYYTDMNGIATIVKDGIDYVANPEILAGAIDLNTLKLAGTTTSDAAQRLQQSSSTGNKRLAPTPQ